jgi:hypothetical protein
MKTYHRILVLCVVLLAAGIPVVAAQPYQSHTHVQGEGGDQWVCDSNANGQVDAEDIHLEGQFWFNVNEVIDYDESGNMLRITWTQSFHGVVTNLNTGEVVTRDRFEGRDSLDFTTLTYSQSGATRHFFRPGEGTLYHDAGRIAIDLVTGAVIEESGPHPLVESGFSSFCQLVDGAGEEIFWEPQSTTIKVLGPA